MMSQLARQEVLGRDLYTCLQLSNWGCAGIQGDRNIIRHERSQPRALRIVHTRLRHNG